MNLHIHINIEELAYPNIASMVGHVFQVFPLVLVVIKRTDYVLVNSLRASKHTSAQKKRRQSNIFSLTYILSDLPFACCRLCLGPKSRPPSVPRHIGDCIAPRIRARLLEDPNCPVPGVSLYGRLGVPCKFFAVAGIIL